MRFEISYQDEHAQHSFDEAFPEVQYCFGEKALKQAVLIQQTKKFGHGVLHVVNGNDVLEVICF